MSISYQGMSNEVHWWNVLKITSETKKYVNVSLRSKSSAHRPWPKTSPSLCSLLSCFSRDFCCWHLLIKCHISVEAYISLPDDILLSLKKGFDTYSLKSLEHITRRRMRKFLQYSFFFHF